MGVNPSQAKTHQFCLEMFLSKYNNMFCVFFIILYFFVFSLFFLVQLKKIIYLCKCFHTDGKSLWKIVGLGTYIWNGVTVRFEFDVLRISQVRTTGQKQSNGTPLVMIILPFGLSSVIGTIYHSVWGFRVARFD